MTTRIDQVFVKSVKTSFPGVTNYSYITNVCLLVMTIYTYYYGNQEIFFAIGKMLLVLFGIRTIFASIDYKYVNEKDPKDPKITNKKEVYQINGSVAIFSTILLVLSRYSSRPLENLKLWPYGTIGILAMYSVISGISDNGIITDNLMTVLLSYQTFLFL